MTYNKEILLYSLLGGLGMLIVNQLGHSLYYLSGLLIPIVYFIVILLTMVSIKKKGVVEYVSFVKAGFLVSLGTSLLGVLINLISGEFKFKSPDTIIIAIILLLSGLLFSALFALFFKRKKV